VIGDRLNIMLNKIKKFEDLRIWKESHALTIEIYKITKGFPKSELYGLTSQLRRASSSVSANIVEGFYRNTTKELIQFLYTSRGSVGEVIYFLQLSKDLNYITKNNYKSLRDRYEKLARSINALINSLKKK
jgi:four helix bundle protein